MMRHVRNLPGQINEIAADEPADLGYIAVLVLHYSRASTERKQTSFGELITRRKEDFQELIIQGRMVQMLISLMLLPLIQSSSCSSAIRLLPTPAVIRMTEGEWRVPQRVTLFAPNECHHIIRAAMSLCNDATLRDRVYLENDAGPANRLRSPGLTFPSCPIGSEAYKLSITPKGVTLAASDEAGLRWGVLTLMQLLASGRCLLACEIEDRPALGLRGLMIDMVRLKERDEVYFRMLEEAASWKINALFLHFTDQNGCSIELKSHPEVVTRHAMSQETLKKLIARGGELGVRVIPEVEAWGHAGWATFHYPNFAEAGKGSFCLSNEDIYHFLDDVIREVASLFPDQYVHIGCDEASYALCDKCKAAATKIGQDKLIANHINRLNAIVKHYGKTSVIWGDIVLRSKGLLSLLDRDIVIENWDYKETVTADKLNLLRSEGRRALAGPALMWNGYKICPSRNNFENVRRFCAHARNQRIEGVATTIWLTQRCVPGNFGYGIAWAAEHSWSSAPGDESSVAAAYLFHRFGLDPTPERIDRVVRLLDVGQIEGTISPAFWWKVEKLLDLEKPGQRAILETYASSLRGLEKGIAGDLLSVKFNRPDFESLLLTAACGEHLVTRQEVGLLTVELIQEAVKYLEASQVESAKKALTEVARSISRMEGDRYILFRRLQDHWIRDRYPDDCERYGEEGIGGSHTLMWWFGSKDTYGYAEHLLRRLEELAVNPDLSAVASLLKVKQ